MPEVKTEIKINATPETVWKHLTAFEKYSEWNPGLSVEIPMQVGAGGRIKVRAQGLPPFGSPIKMEKVTHARDLAWRGSLPGLSFVMWGFHWFHLEKNDDGTLLRHGEQFGGFLATLLWPLLGSRLERAYQQMNEALKKRCQQDGTT